MNTARRFLAGCGIQTAALAFGGASGPAPQTATESYNGTSWTSVNGLNTGRPGLGGAGIQTLALAFGGSPATGATELWNGTSWISAPPMATARYGARGAGTQTVGLAFGGGFPAVTSTEEFTGTPSAGTASTLTTS